MLEETYMQLEYGIATLKEHNIKYSHWIIIGRMYKFYCLLNSFHILDTLFILNAPF